jgi:hypothetical protein
MYLLAGLAGLVLLYFSVNGIVNKTEQEDLYEEARRERVRKLGQMGDTDV